MERPLLPWSDIRTFSAASFIRSDQARPAARSSKTLSRCDVMDIIPAIDLKNGQCVRLAQGDFAKTTIYNTDPVAQACAFAEAGAQWLHVVDLDGAKSGTVQQADIIAAIVRKAPLNVQVGGGIRDEQTIKRLFDAGIK